MRAIAVALLLSVGGTASLGNRPLRCADELHRLVGWTIVAAKTIDGEFEGCDYDRIINFMDGSRLRCSSYGYMYAYMPEAVILARSTSYEGREVTLVKMVVEDEIYDMTTY